MQILRGCVGLTAIHSRVALVAVWKSPPMRLVLRCCLGGSISVMALGTRPRNHGHCCPCSHPPLASYLKFDDDDETLEDLWSVAHDAMCRSLNKRRRVFI